jgi:RecA/RadA recombinase
MAASPNALIETVAQLPATASLRALIDRQVAEFSGVFRGRELTRKHCRLSSGIAALDSILDGGIVRGRVSEIVGRPGFGRTSLAASFAATATRRGEVAAWIDSSRAFDPRSIAAAGADLSRILWIGADAVARGRDSTESRAVEFTSVRSNASSRLSAKPVLMAAEMVLGAGGFGLIVIDLGLNFGSGLDPGLGPSLGPSLGGRAPTLALNAALRLARAAERSGASVIVLAGRRTCGTFAALSLVLGRIRPLFSRTVPGAPALFDGIQVEAYVARNKLGGSGKAAGWRVLVDPTSCAPTSCASTSRAPISLPASPTTRLAAPDFAQATRRATRMVEPTMVRR